MNQTQQGRAVRPSAFEQVEAYCKSDKVTSRSSFGEDKVQHPNNTLLSEKRCPNFAPGFSKLNHQPYDHLNE